MLFKSIILGLIGLICTVSVAANLEGLEPKIDQFVMTYQPTVNSGVAVGIVKDGKLVFFKGYGFRDRSQQLPVTQSTLFRIASNTKSFVSTTLSVLAEKNKVGLENSVQGYLPDFQLENPEVTRQATLVDLLSHRVGLPRHDGFWYFTPFSREQLFEKFQYLEMNKNSGYGFRQRFQYNNLMFMTLGMVLEKTSGLTWQNAIRENILNPLGMERTDFDIYEMQGDLDHAEPYKKDLRLPFYSYETVGAAGVMVSSMSDLSRWVAFHLSHGKTAEGVSLLSPAGQERMFNVESKDNSSGIEFKYGLGWFIQEVAGRRLIWHGGNIDGYSTHVSFMPTENLGVIILTNQDSATVFEIPITYKKNGQEMKFLPTLIYEHLLLQQPKPESSKIFMDGDLPQFDFLKLSLAPGKSWRSPLFGDGKVPMQSEKIDGAAQILGQFDHVAYGVISLYLNSAGSMLMNYYGHEWKLVPTDKENLFDIVDPVTGESWGILVSLEQSSGRVTAISVPFEPSVSPIRFQ